METAEFIVALANSSVGTTVAVFAGLSCIVGIIAGAILLGTAQCDRRAYSLSLQGPQGPPGPPGPAGRAGHDGALDG